MGTVTDSSPSAPVAPIRIEFYGTDAPGVPATVDRPRRAVDGGDGGDGGGAGIDRRIGPLLALLVVGALLAVGVAVSFTTTAERKGAGRDAGHSAADGPDRADVPSPPVLATLPPVHVTPLPFPGAAIEPGRYETDLLGVPVRFSVADATALRTARPGTFMLTPVGTSVSNLADAPHVTFIRLAAWNARVEAADRTFQGVGSIPAADVDAWIADNDLIVGRRSAMVVDGRPAEVLDVRVDPESTLGDALCPIALQPCFWFASVGEQDILRAPIRLDHAISATMSLRLWIITPAGSDPILVEAAVLPGEEAWFDRFEATTIATLEIGETEVELLAGSGSGVPASVRASAGSG